MVTLRRSRRCTSLGLHWDRGPQALSLYAASPGEGHIKHSVRTNPQQLSKSHNKAVSHPDWYMAPKVQHPRNVTMSLPDNTHWAPCQVPTTSSGTCITYTALVSVLAAWCHSFKDTLPLHLNPKQQFLVTTSHPHRHFLTKTLHGVGCCPVGSMSLFLSLPLQTNSLWNQEPILQMPMKSSMDKSNVPAGALFLK